MAKLKVSLLGRFSVEWEGRSVDIRSHAAQWIFAYLLPNSNDGSQNAGTPLLLDGFRAPLANDAAWLDDTRLAVFFAKGPTWIEVSLSVEDLVAEARARLTRKFTAEECEEYQIDPCPTLEEVKDR